MVRQHNSKSHVDLRLCAATIGASALLAMAAIGLMVTQDHEGYAAVKSSGMTVGSTSTQTTPSNAPAVPMAKPAIRGPAK